MKLNINYIFIFCTMKKETTTYQINVSQKFLFASNENELWAS